MKEKSLLECLFKTFLFITIVWHLVAFTVWQFRNPKANGTTVYTYYSDVITFKKLDKFQ